jgi:hypothetical protein
MSIHAANLDERTLRRIILTLAALAVLAERAALRNDRVCCLVVWILHGAEAAVGDLVFDATGTPPPAFADMAAAEDGPSEALRLAACFKALAAILGALLLMAARRSFPIGPVAQCSGRALDGRTQEPHDTS